MGHILIAQNNYAEMGTGKTMMGIAVAAVMHAEGFRRTLILSPPHLVYKWRREILDTVPDAKVTVLTVLNGPDALMKLVRLRTAIAEKNNDLQRPEFFILGRVRLRMGFHWRPAFMVRKHHYRVVPDNEIDQDAVSSYPLQTVQCVACPACGKFFCDNEGKFQLVEHFPSDKRYHCKHCNTALWTLIRARGNENPREAVIKALCELPTIGQKRAEQLLNQFGEKLLSQTLSDNIHQLTNLMDNDGAWIFSDRQAARIEKALGNKEFGLGQGHYQASEFIKRYLPKGFFSLLITDEAHEYKNMGSAQGQAMDVLASQVDKVLLLTGTLMGGYADDLFFLFWRILPHRMMEDGYTCRRNSLSGASTAFMTQHGLLKCVHRSTENHHKTARGKHQSVQTSKVPGFGPKGIARYVLPYTAFLKLDEVGQAVLPSYEETLLEVEMTEGQTIAYRRLRATLTTELRRAVVKGDVTLLGVIMNVLLAWPDCCFREEVVKHPRTKLVLESAPAMLEDTPTPKEQKLIELCREAKAQGRKVLVYTTYTGTRDTTSRLKSWLEQAGFKAAVLRASVDTSQREAWIDDQLDRGIDVLICNPELVKTGLDLLAFPTIVFMQSGFNLYTLMQASRRSWRIGQKEAVKVYFLGYKGTTQISCLTLMAKKIAVTQSTSGTMPETGLDVLNQGGDSIEVALAKQLVS